MTLKERINEDMKDAMRARDAAKLSAIRLLLAAIKQREVDERVQLDDAAVLSVIDEMLKQRRDSITQYEAAGRQDLVDAERFEAELLDVDVDALFDVAQGFEREVEEVAAAAGGVEHAEMVEPDEEAVEQFKRTLFGFVGAVLPFAA